jgi:large subunit ribosomal protein L10e
MGGMLPSFTRRIRLISREKVQIRHNALESARVGANKVLFFKYGETGYRIQLCVYPHIILRENKMIATAGADRLQEGMRRAFGKPTGRAARVEVGQDLLIIYVPEDGVDTAKQALSSAGTKLPMRTRIIVEKIEPTTATITTEEEEMVQTPKPITSEEPELEAEAETPAAPTIATSAA